MSHTTWYVAILITSDLPPPLEVPLKGTAMKLTLTVYQFSLTEVCPVLEDIQWRTHFLFIQACGNFCCASPLHLRNIFFGEIPSQARITSLRLKLGRNVGVMHRLKVFLPFYALKSIYFSLVHLFINYCSIIYLSTFQSHIFPILKLQNKAKRILKMSFYSPVSLPGKSPTKSLYSYFNIFPVRQILAFQCILFRVRYLKDMQPDCFKSFFPGPPSVRPYNTRCPLSKFPAPFIVSEWSRFSPKNVITNYWNTYESFFDQSLSLLTLKSKIMALLISTY